MQRIGFVSLAFVIAALASGTAMAADVEQQIPVIRDTMDSGLTLEISREGARRTATPILTLHDPTVQRMRDRIAKKTDRIAVKEIPPGAPAVGSLSGSGLKGTPGDDSGRPEPSVSSLPPLPGEITVRNVRSFLKKARAARKEKPAPVVVVPLPEQRLGMADTPRRETN